LSEQTINACEKLQYIGILAAGYNVVDIEAAKKRNIPVTNILTYGTAAVAQFAIALLLEICHHVRHHSETVHAGKWTRNPDFCY
jgi:glycerate dehydrogenase